MSLRVVERILNKLEQVQKLELKIIALREGFKTKVASLADEYEERIADLRIELTEQNQNLSAVNGEIQRLSARVQELEQEKVVQEEAAAAEAAAEDSDDSN